MWVCSVIYTTHAEGASAPLTIQQPIAYDEDLEKLFDQSSYVAADRYHVHAWFDCWNGLSETERAERIRGYANDSREVNLPFTTRHGWVCMQFVKLAPIV